MEIEFFGDLPLTEKVSDSPNQDGVVSTIDPDGEVSKRFTEIVKQIDDSFFKEE